MTTVTQTGYLTDERRMLQDAARDFAMQEVLPLANKLDPERGDMPRSLIDTMAELGYFGITIPEEHGGMGLGCFEYCLIAEELARAWMSVGSVIARGNTFMGSQLLDDAQRAAIMPRVARGESLGALALSEPTVGSDLASVSCRARRDGDEWVITGSKYWCWFRHRSNCCAYYRAGWCTHFISSICSNDCSGRCI
jgi:alkylation response protein AidB-like acyl-CoA dehydrogenase